MPDQSDFNLEDPSTYAVGPKLQRRNYNYTVTVNYTDKTGASKTQYVVVASNDVLTEQQIQETAQAYGVGGRYEINASDITSIEITGATASSGM